MFFCARYHPCWLSLSPCLLHTYQPLHQPAEGYSHPSGFHPTSLPSLCGQRAVMPLSCLQQIPPWQKNNFLSFGRHSPPLQSSLSQKKLNTGKFFPLLSPQSSSHTKERGKRENCPKKRQISHHGARLAGLDFDLSLGELHTLTQTEVGRPPCMRLTVFSFVFFSVEKKTKTRASMKRLNSKLIWPLG